tara:strand:- start:1417 stop:1992 length:576 start_codon:yes stop_codon:yes gene_type:complete
MEKSIKLSAIKSNPNNPRVIKDDKFKKLVQSIKEFPKMMELRPMVLNSDSIVLGGNMRLKALKELGYKEVPIEWVKRADDLTEDEARRFIIADNVGFGEHDWELLNNEWNVEELEGWGLDVWEQGSSLNEMLDSDLDLTEDFDPIGDASGLQRVVFIFNKSEEAESYLKSQKVDFVKRNMAWQVNMTGKEL